MSSEEISTFRTSNVRGDNGGDHSTNGLNPVVTDCLIALSHGVTQHM